jgi:hypothetical protein
VLCFSWKYQGRGKVKTGGLGGGGGGGCPVFFCNSPMKLIKNFEFYHMLKHGMLLTVADLRPGVFRPCLFLSV